MQTTKRILCLLACLQTTGISANGWQTFNQALAAINFRHAHAPSQLGKKQNDDERVGNDSTKLTACHTHAQAGTILSWWDVRALKQMSQTNTNKIIADIILDRHHKNIFEAAREVKATALSLLVAVAIYKNREALGKSWEKVKDVLAGIGLVCLCYILRHRIATGVSKVTGFLWSAARDNE